MPVGGPDLAPDQGTDGPPVPRPPLELAICHKRARLVIRLATGV